MGLLALIPALCACTPAARSVPRNAIRTAVEASATVDGLTYVIAVSPTTSETPGQGVVTNSVTNSTDTTVSTAQPRMTITGPDGEVIIDSVPPGKKYIRVGVVIGPNETSREFPPVRYPRARNVILPRFRAS